jgi:O-antigen/teichoic acid export membrane protein
VFSENFIAIAFYFFSFLLYEFGLKVPLGLQQFKSYNKIQIIKPIILFILLIGCSFYLNANLNIVLILVGASFLIPAFFYWRWAFPLETKWDKEAANESLKYGIKVMYGNILQYLNYRADILLIGFFLTKTEVGWYYVSVLIAERLLFLTQATSTILLPAASSSAEQREKTPLLSRLNFTIVVAGSLTIGLSSYWLVPVLFSLEYSNSVLPLVIILPGIISLSISKLLSADLSARGSPQYSTYVSILNFCMNIGFNIILIPRIGIAGAALSSTISYSAALILQAYFYKRIANVSITELMLLKKGDLIKLKGV